MTEGLLMSQYNDFAQRFAAVAVGPHPERVVTMHGGLPMVIDAIRYGVLNSTQGPLEMGRVLRLAVESVSEGRWTLVWVPPWQSDADDVSGLYFALVPAGVLPDGTQMATEYVEGMRSFLFGFNTGREANCMFVEMGDLRTLLTSHDPDAAIREQCEVDANLRRQMHRYATVALEVINELITSLETQYGAQPTARFYTDRLRTYVGYADSGTDTDTVQGALARNIVMAALTLDLQVSAVYAMIEERLAQHTAS